VCFIGPMPGGAWAESCPPQCAAGKVLLGFAAPMSGPPAAFGRQAAKSVEIAVREVNAAGGLVGIPVELAVGDDRCDAGMAVNIARRHIEQDKINFVIGPICPAVAIDTAPIYAKAGVIQFVPIVTTVELTQQNSDNIFRIAATDEQEAQALGAFLAREPKGKRLVVVYGDFFYRRAMAETVRLALPADMKPSARFEPLAEVPGASERLADKLQRDPPDVIYMALDTAPAVELVGKLQKRGVKSVLIGGQRLLSQNFWRAAGKAAEGVLVVAPIVSRNNPEFRKAADLLKQADVVPDLVDLYSYAAVQTWAAAVRRAGSGERKKVIEALRSGEFATAVGRVAFDRNGDRRDIDYSVMTWQGGRLIPGVEWRQ
jgi:branched-chain amino acid transport system substrate-binding protein